MRAKHARSLCEPVGKLRENHPWTSQFFQRQLRTITLHLDTEICNGRDTVVLTSYHHDTDPPPCFMGGFCRGHLRFLDLVQSYVTQLLFNTTN